MSQVDAPQPSATQPAEPKKGSPIRLIVLLGILAIVLTGFLVDLFWMYDQVKAASDRLQKAADEIAERPREEGKPQFLSREDVAKAIGFQPTTAKVENDQLIEHYRWWGALPLERRFIMVKYADSNGKYYSGYEISNRDIFGQDEEESQPPAPAQPVTPIPGDGGMPPGGVTRPPVPAPNEPASDSSEPAPEKDPAPEKNETSDKAEEKPAEAPVKAESSTDQ